MLHELINIDKQIIINNYKCLSSEYATHYCKCIADRLPVQSLVMGSLIFPWEIDEYEKIGINNFKLVGRDGYQIFNDYLNGFIMYLKGVDNVNSIKDYHISAFTHHLQCNNKLKLLTVKDCKKYLPDIKRFIKYGHLCASKCGVECRYCYKCAEKTEKVFKKKQAEQRKRTVPFCKKSADEKEKICSW